MSESIEIRNTSVTFHRGGATVRALTGLNLKLAPSEYVTVIGPNGAGKSTLVNVLAGSVPVNEGEIFLGGKDVTRLPDYRRAQWIARVFQDPAVGTCEGLSVIENAALLSRRGRNRSPFKFALTRDHTESFRALLAEYGRDLQHRLKQDVSRLSGGQRQLLAVIMAVAERPEVLLLDEHTSALDPEMAELVMRRTDDLVREQHVTTIMVTHNMRWAARFGDRLLIMSRGRIAADITREEKVRLAEDGLIQRFRQVAAGELTDSLVGG
ncbi:MAG: ATP-binding cassette domain-containing protein [Chloroflexi bacterium]|nr:ATP-binding cassette domain-containing protein [Chloroflexota bacterium]